MKEVLHISGNQPTILFKEPRKGELPIVAPLYMNPVLDDDVEMKGMAVLEVVTTVGPETADCGQITNVALPPVPVVIGY